MTSGIHEIFIITLTEHKFKEERLQGPHITESLIQKNHIPI